MFVLVFPSVCMDSCACPCISKCLYGFLCLCLYFQVFVWILVLVLVFLSVCMDSCVCACISKCLYGFLCLCLYFVSVCMDSCACASSCLYGLLCI